MELGKMKHIHSMAYNIQDMLVDGSQLLDSSGRHEVFQIGKSSDSRETASYSDIGIRRETVITTPLNIERVHILSIWFVAHSKQMILKL